jgi:hypothetical protein
MHESVVIDGRHLFDPVAETQISRFSFLLNPLGKRMTIRGYPAAGATVSYERHGNAVTFDNVFYVHEIIGWKYMCFHDAYLQRAQCFWVELPEE